METAPVIELTLVTPLLAVDEMVIVLPEATRPMFVPAASVSAPDRVLTLDTPPEPT